jgi:hypothetical protein
LAAAVLLCTLQRANNLFGGFAVRVGQLFKLQRRLHRRFQGADETLEWAESEYCRYSRMRAIDRVEWLVIRSKHKTLHALSIRNVAIRGEFQFVASLREFRREFVYSH